MKSDQFLGKVAVVTGAANGIGLATVAHFSNHGADIVAVDLHGSPLVDAQKAGEEAGRQVVVVEADVTDESEWAKVTEQAMAAFQRIDILINCAGISGPLGRFEDCTVEAFDQVMAVNVRGIFLGMQAVIPAMRAQGGGNIVNISSISGERGHSRVASYVTSKHAVNGLTKCAALDLIDDGIRVNAVSPAPIDTDMVKRAEVAVAERLEIEVEEARGALSANLPIKRYGQPAEVAAVIAFLCSDSSSFMTGAIVPVDGGALAQ